MAIDMGIRARFMVYIVDDYLNERCCIVVHCDRVLEEMAMLMLEVQKSSE